MLSRRVAFGCLFALALSHAQQTTPSGGASAVELLTEGERLGRAGSRKEALVKFEAALELARTGADRKLEARALTRLGQTNLQLDNFAEGLRFLELAAPVWRAAQDRFQEALVVHNIGSALWSMGESPAAIAKFESALEIRREIKDRIGEAYTLRGLASCYWSMGEAAEALDLNRRALSIRVELKEAAGEGDSRNALGLLYALLGDPTRARAEFEQSYAIWQKLGDRTQASFAQSNLGWTAVGQRQFQESLQFLTPALQTFESANNRIAQAYALHNLGNAYAGLEQYGKAVECLERSLRLKRDLGDRWGETYTLHALGETYLAQGDKARGTELLQQALNARRALKDRTGLILSLGSLARLHRDSGDLPLAEAEIREAIGEIEASRSRVVSQDLRASYLASKRDYFEFLVDLLASQNRPAEALEAAEQSRGRLFLDRLGDVLAEVRKGADVSKEQAAQRKVNAIADRLERLASSKAVNPAREAKLKQDLEAALAEERDASEAVRRASPRYADLIEPRRVTVPEMQKMLEPGDVLLAFALGRERSYGWIVAPASLRMQKLPPRSRIESAVAAANRAISDRKADWKPSIEILERLLGLRPPPDRASRIIVAADGALETVPFAVFPSIGTEIQIAYLPSASALALVRSQKRGTAAGGTLVLADPVLSADDPRMPAGATALRTSITTPLPRLRFSRIEADSIAALQPTSTKEALDFDAARSLLLSPAVRNQSIVHLATHAVVDPAHPDLSKVALSAFDSRGNSVEPSVRLHEIFTLDLRARLVTLSACRSATGANLAGEGLVSLTRGFQYAGAASVLATLWDVEDRSTAFWMEEFYRSLLVRRMNASASVRAAANAIRGKSGWEHPYYWAGFVLQGEWR